MSLDSQLPPPPQDQQAYPAPAAPQQGTSGLAVTGFILAFVAAPVGLVLSLIAIAKTGAGKAKGRGLAIAGVIVSLIVLGAGIALVVAAANSTQADPGCTSGKQAILDGADNVNEASIQKTVDGLNAAAAKAKHDDVRAAMTAVSADYTQLLTAMKTGQVPAGLEDKLNADAAKVDSLCSIG